MGYVDDTVVARFTDALRAQPEVCDRHYDAIRCAYSAIRYSILTGRLSGITIYALESLPGVTIRAASKRIYARAIRCDSEGAIGDAFREWARAVADGVPSRDAMRLLEA